MEEQYKAGDLVRLKSGGPKMTVNQDLSQVDVQVSCVWFPTNVDQPSYGVFNVRALMRTE